MKSLNGLNIYLFGFPRIVLAGQPLHLSRRKTLGLLAYLAFTKRQTHRDRLADLFWPDEDDGHAHGSLRVVLSEIHKTLDPELLPTDNGLVGPLDMERVTVDIEDFQVLMAQIRHIQNPGRKQNSPLPESIKSLLKKAATLYCDDFLAGFTLRKCPQFSDWQLQQGEYFRRELCHALDYLITIYEEDGEWEEGIIHCRRLLEENYLNEEAHCRLMRLYAAAGQRDSAINQFKLCKKALREELQLSPEESTVALFESILHSRPVTKQITIQNRQNRSRLAVLPFRSLTNEQEWFGDAITDALITELSSRENFEVISYNSSRCFYNTEKSMRQIASELNVHHLIEGRVLKAGDDIRISAQLVEPMGDRVVWGESYRGSFTGILELQEKIVRAIAGQVTGELVHETKTEKVPDTVPGAREACLMGDFYRRKSENEEGIEIARDYYLKAANIDSSCADAFAGLAFTYFSILGAGRDLNPTEESRATVRRYIRQALQINPDNVRARMVLAGSLWEWDFDFPAAEQEFEKILQINPHHIESLCWYSELELLLGKIDEMFTLVQRAHVLNPLDIVTLDHQYRYFLATLQYRRCLEILNRIDELHPGFSHISFLRAIMCMRLGQFEPAVEHIKKALAVLPHYDAYRNVLSLAYAWSGRKEDALQVISGMLRDRENQEPIRAYDISLSYHAVGRDDEALQWLEKSYEEDKLYTLDALSQPFFGELHWDPRYRNIVERSGLPHRLDYVRKALKIQREGKDHHSSE